MNSANLSSEMLVLCIRAMVPTLHTANTVGKRSSSKYKVGQEVTGRILEVDAAKKRVSMTLKKLLCSDKLPVITTFQVSFCDCRASLCIGQHRQNSGHHVDHDVASTCVKLWS